MEAPQSECDVTNGFGDRDFVLAVCTSFLRKCGHIEVIRDFRSEKNGGIPFPVDGSIAEKIWRIIQFLVGGIVIHFAGIFHLSFSVQKLFKNFMLVQWLNFFLIFGANMTPENFFAIIQTPKRHFLEKICVDWGMMVQVAIAVRAVGVSKNKRKGKHFW
jgi:hypothetical protein